jgi:hypothetical protein
VVVHGLIVYRDFRHPFFSYIDFIRPVIDSVMKLAGLERS